MSGRRPATAKRDIAATVSTDQLLASSRGGRAHNAGMAARTFVCGTCLHGHRTAVAALPGATLVDSIASDFGEGGSAARPTDGRGTAIRRNHHDTAATE